VVADYMETCLRDATQNGDADRAWGDLQKALESFTR
jgi:hypothetical protein